MEKTPFALIAFLVVILALGANSVEFNVKNNCPYTVWPATLSGAGGPLSPTGFQLNTGASLTLNVPYKWSGRLWPRTGCATDSSGKFTCQTGDCGSGQVECNGKGGIPPATLAEFTIQDVNNVDFYDASLVDGFNVPISIVPQALPQCKKADCPVDLNARCPPEFQIKGPDGKVVACKNACLALGSKQYCCTEDFHDPKICKATNYSKIFKDACPLAYSYPFDDETSTFTCTGANYAITFCP